MMPIFAPPTVKMPGQFGPSRRELGVFDNVDCPDLVLDGDAFGDADDEINAGVHGLHDAVGGPARGDEDAGRIRPRRVLGRADRIEDGDALHRHPALAGRDAADDLGAVLDHLRRVELALAARDALDDNLGVLVYEDAHR